MTLISALVVRDGTCLAGQLIYDDTELIAGHITSIFVVIGVALDTSEWYDKLPEFAGTGVSLPITSFGHSLIHGALAKAQSDGVMGILLGMFDLTAAGITNAILFVFLAALAFHAKSR